MPIFFFDADDSGVGEWFINNAHVYALTGGTIYNSVPSSTNPTLRPDVTDVDSGIGAGTADAVTVVAGGDEAWTFAEGAAGTDAGDSIAFVSDVVTAPSSNPTGGVYLYSDADSLFIRDTGGTVTDLAAGGSATWEGLTNSADTSTTYTASATAETVTFDFESSFTTGTQFLIEQSAGTPSGGTLFGILEVDTDVTPFQITGAGSTVLAQINNPTDAASAQAMILAAPDRASPTTNDEAYISFFNEDAGGVSEEFSRLSWIAKDTTAGNEDGGFRFDVDVGGALTEGFRIETTGTETQVVVDGDGVNTTPTIEFGNASGEGFYRPSADEIRVAINATYEFRFTTTNFEAADNNGPAIRNTGTTGTTPVLIPNKTDLTSGVGSGGTGEVSIVANSVEMARFDESGSGDAQIILASGSIGPAEVVAALKTDSLSFNIFGVTTADDGAQWEAPSAVTITQIDCSTDAGTVDIQFDERVLTTPTTGGTNVMAAALVCDTNNQQQTSFDNAEIAAGALLNMDVDAVSGAGQVRVHVRYTID